MNIYQGLSTQIGNNFQPHYFARNVSTDPETIDKRSHFHTPFVIATHPSGITQFGRPTLIYRLLISSMDVVESAAKPVGKRRCSAATTRMRSQ